MVPASFGAIDLKVLLGVGARWRALQEQARGLRSMEFVDPLPDGRFEDALAAADLLLVNEKPGVLDMCVPGKLTSYFAAGRPVLAATDPRSGAAAEVSAYVDQILEQARLILQTQRVANLHTTPPLFDAIARSDPMVDLVNEKIRYVLLSGAHVDFDTRDILREIFPRTAITMAFGSTMILSQAKTRIVDGDFAFDPRSPYVVFWVVDPDSGEPVPTGSRGQVVMNHISKGMFVPNNLERDTAIRMPGPDGQIGDSLSEIAPVATFDGEAVIEGVY